MYCLTKPLSAEAEADERWRNGEIVNDGSEADPEQQLVIGSNQLKTFDANHRQTV